MKKLVLLRHGQSQWNLENRFTGWIDVPVTEKGAEEALKAAEARAKAAEERAAAAEEKASKADAAFEKSMRK